MLRQVRRKTAVLLDQDQSWLSALERVIEDVGFGAIGKLTSPSEAMALIRDHRPDLFMLDTELNGSLSDGTNIVREASMYAPAMKTVVVSAAEDPERIAAAVGAGAAAYVFKRAQPIELQSAVRQVFRRSFYLAGPLHVRAGRPAEANDAGLTRRECEILQLVAEGGTNSEVARKLWVTEQTVKFHLSNTYRKLKVSNRTEASRWAHAHGLLSEDAPYQNAALLAATL